MSIKAIKLALDALSPRFGMPEPEYNSLVSCAIDELRTAIEQAEKQEIEPDKDWVENDGCPTEKSVLQRFWREHQQAEKQEPVAVWELQESGWDTIADSNWMETLPVGTKLYTAPPQREWVKLTDKERMQLAVDTGAMSADWLPFMESVEAKLKEKNT